MASVKELPTQLQVFAFQGLDLAIRGEVAKTNCPFCGDDSQKMQIVSGNGMFRCVRCDEQGNVYQFLKSLYNASIVDEHQLEELASEKSVPVDALRSFGIRSSCITGEPLVPAYNSNGVLSNLYRLATIDNKLRALQTPNCKAHSFGSHLILPEHRTIWVVEGLWDAAILWYIFQILQITDQGVIGVPGSSNLYKDVCKVSLRQYLNVVFDNDHPLIDPKTNRPRLNSDKRQIRPGYDGQQKFLKMMCEEDTLPRIMKEMSWGDAGCHDHRLPSGYDIKDLFLSAITFSTTNPPDTQPFLPSEAKPTKLILDTIPSTTIDDIVSVTNGEMTDPQFESICKDIHSAAQRTLDYLNSHLTVYSPQENSVVGQAPAIHPIACSQFKELVDHYTKNGMVVTPELQMTLQTMLAVSLSTPIDGDQVWLRVIGPPSSGKSTLAEALSCCREKCKPISILTGLHSGFIADPSKGAQGDSGSLIPALANMTAIMKDGDTLLQNPRLSSILSELRDFYDRTSRAEYRNKVKFEAEGINSTWILCGTDDLRNLNRTSLGERFLDIEIIGRNTDHADIIKRAQKSTLSKMKNSIKKMGPKELNNEANEDQSLIINRATYGFLMHIHNSLPNMEFPDCSDEQLDRIESIGKLLSHIRARRKSQDTLNLRPRAEVAARLVNQFTKLAICLSMVAGEREVSDTTVSILRKIGIDSGRSYQQEVVTLLYRRSDLDVLQICNALNLPETSVRSTIESLQAFGLVDRKAEPNNSGQRGRHRHVWQLSSAIHDLCRKAGWPK